MAGRRAVIDLSPRQMQAVIVVLAAIIPAVLVMLGVLIFRQVDGSDDGVDTAAGARGTTAPASRGATVTASERALVSWVSANLQPDVPIAADDAVVPALRRAGFRAIVPIGDSGGVRYLFSSATGAAGKNELFRRSQPLAQQGTTSVREVMANDPADVPSQLRVDAELRTAGGRQLARNPAITYTGSLRDAVAAGRLDLRVQNVLGELAGNGRVRVDSVPLDPLEAQAGRPARSIVVTTSAGASATADVLRTLSAPYRPGTVTTTGARTLRAVWTPTVVADAPVGN